MRIMCVDNDQTALRRIMKYCSELQEVTDVVGFTTEMEAMAWLRFHPCDITFMETYKPGLNGLQLAANVRKLYPEVAVVFVTDEAFYARDAIRLRVTGYLLKPLSRGRLKAEIEYVKSVMNGGNTLALKNQQHILTIE